MAIPKNPPKSFLLWEALPLWIGSLLFLFLAVINWPYMSRLMMRSNHPDVGLTGPMLLGIALFIMLIAGGVLFLHRSMCSHVQTMAPLLKSALGTLILALALVILFVGLFVIVLGPAAVTMTEQMPRP